MIGRAATITVRFPQLGRAQAAAPSSSPGRRLRVARLLAFAHHVDDQIRAGVYDDLAHAARAFGLTRARVTQIVGLTLLAPAIQDEIVAMSPVTNGRDPITERTLRPVVAEADWNHQLARWETLHHRFGGRPHKEDSGDS